MFSSCLRTVQSLRLSWGDWLVLFSFNRWEQQGTEGLRNFSKITQPAHRKTEIQNQVVWLQSLCFEPLYYPPSSYSVFIYSISYHLLNASRVPPLNRSSEHSKGNKMVWSFLCSITGETDVKQVRTTEENTQWGKKIMQRQGTRCFSERVVRKGFLDTIWWDS